MSILLYSVSNWNDLYENNRTRELKHMAWVPVSNKHDGDGYTELVSMQDGAGLYGCWHGILQVASKCKPRGVLIRENGEPHNDVSIARVTHLPVGLIGRALMACERIKWLESKVYVNPVSIPHPPAVIPHPSADPSVPFRSIQDSSIPGGCKGGESVVAELPIKIVQREIAKHFNREPDAPWSYEEERLLVDVAKRPKMTAEWTEIVAYHTRNKDGYRRQSVLSLLQNWTGELDKARAKPPEVIDVNGHAQTNGAMLVLRQKEFERVTAEMQTIKATYGDHQSWNETDRKRFNALKDRKKQLKNELGLTA